MPLSLHESRRRSRRQRRIRVVTAFTIFATLAGVVFASYLAGGSFADREVARLNQDIAQLKDEIAALGDQNVKFQAEAQEAALRELKWKQLYERDVPAGPSKDLHARIQARLAEGIHPARLDLVIGSVVNEPACDEKPVTKRFIVRTPLHPGGNDSVGFADNAITITAEGKPATDGTGNGRATFDPAQPVHVSFLLLGGRKVDANGILPILQSVMTETAEYRFTLVAGGNKGFVNVTGDRCRVPE